MMQKGEISEELKSVLSGKTLDALFPPLLFVLVNGFVGLDTAVITAPALALLLAAVRILRRQNWLYALGGLLGVGIAASFALLTQSAAGYFIPAIAGSAFLFLAALISLLAGKPLAAWASHLTRGWPLGWFRRHDIKPAYREVTIFWALFFFGRLTLQVMLFQSGEAAHLAWANTLLGWPVTILVLIFSYIYGIWRLRRLGGPGVDEYREGKSPPWRGQTRGF